MNNDKGMISEILGKGCLTTEEIKKKLKERSISEKPYHIYWVTSLVVAAILWLLPAIAKYTGWRFLSFFGNLLSVEFPIAVIVIGALLIIVGISLESQASYRRKERGGLKDVDETMFILKEGPYKVIRHPGFLAEMVLFPSIPIVLSRWIPFTMLSIISCVLVIGMITYMMKVEERFNVRKWGEEYRKYMREVPAINFVRGFSDLRKRQS